MPLPRHYERLVLNWLKSVEGEPQRAPYKEFRQFYFGSLLDDSNTFPREWPHVHFGPGSGAEMTPRTAVTDGGVLAVKEFADGAPGLIDGGIRFGTRPGIGIGDGQPSEPFSPEQPGLLSFFPLWVKECVIGLWLIRIAVGPAIDGNSLYVACGVKSSTTQHSRELIADISLELRKWCLQQLGAARAMLIARRQARLARCAKHPESHRLFRFAGELIPAERYGVVQRSIGMISTWGNNVMYAELRKRGPVAQGHVRVHQRRFHEVR